MKTQINRFSFFALAAATLVLPVRGAVRVIPTTDTAALGAALNPRGLTITSVSLEYGIDGQFGTYSNFNLPPVTITNGVVLSSGDVSHVGDPPDPSLTTPEPSYWMGDNNSPEFDAYGTGHIENFYGSLDVAVLRVDFNLATNSQVKFDFVFGSVEYPYWTSEYTDALLVFLDGTDPTNQITFDANNQPVQVGLSFSGLVTTGDRNTTFADPHGVLGRLTTTTARLGAGAHTIRFEVGDVNDDLLDSAAFIGNFRTGAGTPGTGSDQPPPLAVANVHFQTGTNRVGLTWTNNGVDVVLERAGDLMGPWTTVSSPRSTNSNWILTTVTNNTARQFFRLRAE
jgi:hypothetical protein